MKEQEPLENQQIVTCYITTILAIAAVFLVFICFNAAHNKAIDDQQRLETIEEGLNNPEFKEYMRDELMINDV